LPDLARLAKLALGARDVLDGELQGAELVFRPGNGGPVAESLCGVERDVQRPDELRPAHQQGQQTGQRPRQPQRLLRAPFAVEPLEEAQQRIDLAAELLGVKKLALR
jgi:hypothetical protein